MKLYKMIFFFIPIFFLFGCSHTDNTDNPNKENPNKITDAVLPSIEPEDVTDFPKITEPEDVFPVVYEIDNSYCYNHFNYLNKMPLVKISDYILEFSYDGDISFLDTLSGNSDVFHVSEKIDMKNYFTETIFKDNWYYMGFILTEEYIFIRYDYLGINQYSMLFRMNLSDREFTICVVNPYYKKETLNNFVIFKDTIYYTYITQQGSNYITSVIETDFSGNNRKTIYSFEINTEVEYLFPHENFLYVISESEDIKSLCRYDLSSNRLELILEECISDFLYVYDDYVLLNIYNNTHLCYYDINDRSYYYIKLTSDEETYFSQPFISNEGLFVAVFPWNEPSETKIARLDMKNGTIDKYIFISNEFYRILGITGDILYAEDAEIYKLFDITTGMELFELEER